MTYVVSVSPAPHNEACWVELVKCPRTGITRQMLTPDRERATVFAELELALGSAESARRAGHAMACVEAT